MQNYKIMFLIVILCSLTTTNLAIAKKNSLKPYENYISKVRKNIKTASCKEMDLAMSYSFAIWVTNERIYEEFKSSGTFEDSKIKVLKQQARKHHAHFEFLSKQYLSKKKNVRRCPSAAQELQKMIKSLKGKKR